MSVDPGYHGELSGKIYARMLKFLDEEKGDVRPVDVVRWWAFWEAACPPDIHPGRLFWLSLAVSLRLDGDSGRAAKLFEELTGWLMGEDDTHVEIVRLDGDNGPSVN